MNLAGKQTSVIIEKVMINFAIVKTEREIVSRAVFVKSSCLLI